MYGDRIDEVLARWTAADGPAWYLGDKQGSVRDVIDAVGSLIGTRAFDTFGRIVAESGAVDRFAFQGREWESAVGLYQFRARWYDPVLRQFASEDPLGFAAGDWNTRRFVGNNPLTHTDPSGMLAESEYSSIGDNGTRTGAAFAGAILGFICGFLDGWFDPKVAAANQMEHALISGAIGGVIGGALGFALSPATGLPAKYVAGIAGIAIGVSAFGIGQAAAAGNAGQVFARVTCLVAAAGMAGRQPQPGKNVVPPPRPNAQPPQPPKPPQPNGGCFVAGTEVVVFNSPVEAIVREQPWVVEILELLSNDDAKWLLAGVLLVAVGSLQLRGQRKNKSEEFEPIWLGGESPDPEADEPLKLNWK